MHVAASSATVPTNTGNNLLTILHTSSSSDQPSRIIDLIHGRIHNKRPFFGLEVSPTVSAGTDVTLDYARFGSDQPLFTSITWLSSQFVGADMIATTPAVRLAQSWLMTSSAPGRRSQPLLMHLTCERMTAAAVRLAISDCDNVLALRGGN